LLDDLKHFRAQAIIFDKDGTLIDFDAMWGGWVVYLAEQLRLVSGSNVHAALYLAMGYDDNTRKVFPYGKLASQPMALLYQLTVDVMQFFGLDAPEAERVVEAAWCVPDPIMLAKPLTDTRTLFSNLRKHGIQIAIATADDRTPTQAMLEAFDIAEFITTMVCGDDGIPSKPSPHMVSTICERLKIDPARAMVIGDTLSDLKMARAAGAGLAVGVLSGVSSARELTPYADVLIDSVDELHMYAQVWAERESPFTQTGLNQDFAF